MAMTWLQQMFTPERSGSYQWQGRPDQGGGEFTGEQRDAQGNITYEGDAQDLRFVPRAHRGPGNTVGQKMPQAYAAQDGDGRPTGGGDYDSAGMDNVEDISITEQGPSGSISANIAESMQPRQTMTPGSSRWSGVSMNDNWIQDPYQAPNAFSTGDADPLKRIRALRESQAYPDNWSFEGPQGRPMFDPEIVGPAAEHSRALQANVLGAGSNDAALLPRTEAQLPFGGPTADELDVHDVNSPGVGGQQTQPTVIAQLMKLLGGMVGGGMGSMFTPSQAGAGMQGPTTPKIAPPMFVPPDTLGSTGGQFKNIYEGQTGGPDVMNALQAYMRRSN